MGQIELVATERDAGERIDRYLAARSGLSRAVAQRLIEQGNVLLNGLVSAKGSKLAVGDRLSVSIPPPVDSELAPQDIPLDIAYEDRWLLVVNKPKGMVVHPAAGNPDQTLVNALLHHCGDSLSGIGGEKRPGIVHRIDKDTSGLLVVAKDDRTHQLLSEQFAAHSIERVYNAVVYGRFREAEGVVDAPIGRSRTDRKKMTITEQNAKRAVTQYRVIAAYPGFSHLELRLKTGRTHQIRVHMASLGHPVAGDTVYGPKKVIKSLGGQCLHAGVLGFVHPATGREMHFEAPLPEYFEVFLHKLSGEGEGLHE